MYSWSILHTVCGSEGEQNSVLQISRICTLINDCCFSSQRCSQRGDGHCCGIILYSCKPFFLWLKRLPKDFKGRQHFPPLLKIPKEILQLKSTTTEMKNSLQSLKSRFDHAEERIRKCEDRTMEII